MFLKLLNFSLSFLSQHGWWMTIATFIFWLAVKNNKMIYKKIEHSAKRKYERELQNITLYNHQNPSHKIELKSGWYDIYKVYCRRIDFLLLFSMIICYLSFLSEVFKAFGSGEIFFNLLAVATTIFLSVLSLWLKTIR